MAETDVKKSRFWGMLCHLTALSIFIGTPLGNLSGPLIVWLVKKNEMPFVDAQGKESLNLQISIMIYGVVSSLLLWVLIWFLLPVLLVVAIVLVIRASLKTNQGESFHYPCTIRFLKRAVVVC